MRGQSLGLEVPRIGLPGRRKVKTDVKLERAQVDGALSR